MKKKKKILNNEGNERKLYDENEEHNKIFTQMFLYISSRKGGLDRLF